MTEAPDASVRLDVWLWRARMFKTRGLAASLIGGKGVRVSRSGQVRRVTKPGATIRIGDVLTFSRGPQIETLEVVDLGVRRGPAGEAAMLYRRLGGEND